MVTADGSAVMGGMTLSGVSLESASLYPLSLTVDASSASGNYNVFSASDPAARAGTVRGG